MIPRPGPGIAHADGRERRAFYEYHAAMMEPWDGPRRWPSPTAARSAPRSTATACVRRATCHRRRMIVVMASESGVLPIPDSKIVKKWRLQPGKMFLIDMEQGRIIDDKEIKQSLAAAKPYAEWIETHQHRLTARSPAGSTHPRRNASLLDRQQAFGYTQEDIKFILEPMGKPARRPPARWATTRRWRCCRRRTSRSTTTSASSSRRSPTRRSTRSASNGDVAGVLHRPAPEPARDQRDQPAVPSRGAASRC